MNVPNGLVPFDLKIALMHPERVRTRNGHKVLFLAYSTEAVEESRVIWWDRL